LVYWFISLLVYWFIGLQNPDKRAMVDMDTIMVLAQNAEQKRAISKPF